MEQNSSEMRAGGATAASPPVKDLLAQDTGTLEYALRESGNFIPERKKIPFSQFTDPEFAKLEMEKIWKKCWQVVGREEDIPEIGDRKPYQVGNLSYIIIRSGKDEFRALQNACLHRGTLLCSGMQIGNSIKCPFHGWEWNIDGSLKNIPSRWDFLDVADAAYHLPEAKLGRWGGYLFINPDPDAGPLEAALGVLPRHFGKREAEDRYTVIGFRKKLRGNWKQVQGAFFEAYHTIETHPNIMSFNGDTTTAYDVWDDGVSQVSRLITPAAVPSGHLGDDASRLQAAREAMRTFAMPFPGIVLPEITSGETGRAEVAAWRRKTMGEMLGIDFSRASDSYMLDATQYFMFPNFWPWYGEGLPLSYQFMAGATPDECVMEARLTLPVPEGCPRPPAPELVEIDFETPIADVPGMGFIASVFDQDFFNTPLIQAGLKAPRTDDACLTLGRHQEIRIQAFHDMIARKLAE